MKQKMTNQQTKVTTPLSPRRKATGRRALLGNGAGGEAINPKDLDLHPCFSQYDIWYNVRDYVNCQQVRFYSHARSSNQYHRKGELYEIPVYIKDKRANDRKRGISPNGKPYLRRFIIIRHKGKRVNLYCSHLVFKIGWTFPIPDPHKNVIDHISHDTLNDRRNNLQIWSAKENVNTPAAREARLSNLLRSKIVSRGLCNAKRAEVKAHRIRLLKLTGHMPSLEDAMRDLGLSPPLPPSGSDNS